MRVLFALPGIHRHDRGAEVAFISIANELCKIGDDVTLIGSGPNRTTTAYRYLHAPSISRDYFYRCPSIPILRNDCAYEELSFLPGLFWKYRPNDYDVTLTCSYPFINWLLRRPTIKNNRPAHVFVTENGDWPAFSGQSEYRLFRCDGLICTNPDFYERNKDHWNCQLIPNGIDCERFKPSSNQRVHFGLPENCLIVLMVSALIDSKRVTFGIETVRNIPNAHLVVAGTGPLKREIESAAAALMPGRFTNLSLSAQQMPALYHSANVFLHLSKEESFGNVFLEAMASGLPIVAHDSPRTRWLLGNNHFLIDTERPENTAEAISAAAGMQFAYREEAIARAKSFSWPHIGKMYHDFLETIIKSSTRFSHRGQNFR